MIPMHKETGKGYRHIHQPVVSIRPGSLPKPAVPVTNPMSKTEVKTTKQISHFGFPELTKVVNPASGLCFQEIGNFIYRKMSPAVNFEFKENLIDPLLTFLTDSRGKANAQYSSGLDNPWLKSVSKKVKGFVYQLHWYLPLLIVVTVYYFSLSWMEAEFAFLQPFSNCI